MKKDILSAVTSYREEMVRFTRELVGIPTENPPGHFYRDCVDAIATKLGELGLECRVHRVRRPSPESGDDDTLLPRFWLESFYGNTERTLYFHGHYDVVPAVREGQFKAQLRGDELYGRGSSDMKGGVSAMIYGMRALKDCGISLDGRVGLILVPDEETGGKLGSHYLAKAGVLGRNAVGMLTAEPTGGVVWNASRGAVSLLVNVKGKAAHVGLQHQGINAFERMLEVGQSVLELKKDVEERKTSYRIEPEEARRSILMMGGIVKGGDNFNLVPDRCSFTLDRRVNPEESLEEEKQRMLDVLDALRGGDIDLEIEVIQEGPSAGVSEDCDLGRALASSIEEVSGETARFEMCPGLLEIRFYAERGVPAFAYGPGLLTVSHGPDEYIRVSDIESVTAVYALTAAHLLTKHQ
jgi:succinyl-diaminopimelate desuccinylase